MAHSLLGCWASGSFAFVARPWSTLSLSMQGETAPQTQLFPAAFGCSERTDLHVACCMPRAQDPDIPPELKLDIFTSTRCQVI